MKEDETLYELLDTPFMISIVTLTFAGQTAAALKRTGTLDDRRDRLFEAYAEWARDSFFLGAWAGNRR